MQGDRAARGTAEERSDDAGGSRSTSPEDSLAPRDSRRTALAGSQAPPRSQARLSPLKVGRSDSPTLSPFQGGRQRSAATMQGDRVARGTAEERSDDAGGSRSKADGRGAQRRCRGIAQLGSPIGVRC